MRILTSLASALLVLATGSAAWAQGIPVFVVNCVPGPNCVNNRLFFSVAPNGSASVTIEIENRDATRSIDMVVEVGSFSPLVDRLWYSASPVQGIRIPPGGRGSILLTVNVPENTPTFTLQETLTVVKMWRYTDQTTGAGVNFRVAIGLRTFLTVLQPFESSWYMIESPLQW